MKCLLSVPYTDIELAKCFCNLMQVGYPVFFLEKKLGLYLRELYFTNIALEVHSNRKAILNEKHHRLMILILSLEIAREDDCFKLFCSQIERTTLKCDNEISEFSKDNPGIKEAWESTSVGGMRWAAFKNGSKTYASLKLSS